MADAPPSFSNFLFAGAIAGISVGGSLLITWIHDDKESLKQITYLSAQVEAQSKELDKLVLQQNAVITLGIKVSILENDLLRQTQALEELRRSRVPLNMREYQK